MEAETVTPVSEPLIETAGQLFREKHGYSRTLKELVRKYKCSIPEYRKLRRERKKAQRKLQKDKHTTAKAKRGVKELKPTKKR